jgi:hypothetical protein
MSDVVICDGCGEPIDQTVSYFTASVQTVQMIDGVLLGGDTVKKDWHTDHLPSAVLEASDDG